MFNKLLLFISINFFLFDSIKSQDENSLETFVVTAQYEKTLKEKSINKIKVIDEKKIEALGAVSLKDVLANELNIRINQDNVLGSSMSVQGLSGQNVKILIDGVPVIGRLNGNIDLSQINLNNVERIELIEGPLAVNYGTSALAGTINIITKKQFKSKPSLSINNYVESVGQYNTDAFVTIRHKNSNIGFSIGKYFFDGWNPTDPIYEIPKPRDADTNRSKEWNPKDQMFSKLEYNLVLDSQSLRTYLKIYNEEITNRGNPRTPYFESAFDDYYNTFRRDFGLDYNKKFAKSKIRIISSINHYKRIKNTFFNDLTTLNEQLTSNLSDQDTNNFIQIMSRGNLINKLTRSNFQIGYDMNYQLISGRRIKNTSNQLFDGALFGSYQYTPSEKLIIKPAVRYTYNNKYNAPIIPSLNLKYHIEKITFRASYAHGFRAPSLKELYFNFVDINHNIVGNTQLLSENSQNYIADLQWMKKSENIKTIIDGGLFFNDIRNLITLAINPDNNKQYTYINIGIFKTVGAQINTSFDTENINFKLGISNIGRYNDLNNNDDVPKFNFSPELRANIIYQPKNSKIKLAAFYKYNGKLNAFYIGANEEITQSFIDAYHNLDFNLTKELKKQKIFWTIGAKNILDVKSVNSITSAGVHSSSSSSVPVSWGRSFFTSFKIRLN